MATRATLAGSAVPGPAATEAELARATMGRVTLHLVPFLFILYICNYIDRSNVAIAALQMNRDLRFSASAYGLGSGVFFVSYALLEVPSNILLARLGARRWIARIMLTWGVIAASMMFVRTPAGFYTLRFLLGAAEAGFFPGIIYYLGQWFPAAWRARAVARVMVAIPISGVLGGPLGGLLLGLDRKAGLGGWQWLFLMEGLPAIALGIVVLLLMRDRPADAPWLASEQKAWLMDRLRSEERDSPATAHTSLRALTLPILWLTAVPYLLINTAGYAYTFWAPIVVRDALHTSPLATGLVTGFIGLLAAGASLLVGASSDRRQERCLHAAFGATLCGLGYVGAALLPAPGARIAAYAVVSIGSMSFFPGFWCLPGLLLRGPAAAAGIALVNSIANIGGLVGPSLVGALKDATGGNATAFLILGTLPFAAAAVMLVLRRQAAFARGPHPVRPTLAVGSDAAVPAVT